MRDSRCSSATVGCVAHVLPCSKGDAKRSCVRAPQANVGPSYTEQGSDIENVRASHFSACGTANSLNFVVYTRQDDEG